MSVIEDLYNGALAPVEQMIPPNSNYRQICRQIGDDREYFEQILPEKDQERFKKWNSLIYEYEKMIELTNFSNGFKLGMRLGCEVFGQEEDAEESLEKWSLLKKETEVP